MIDLFHLLYFNFWCVQTYRKRTDRASDQNQLEGDHDAERPGECHLQRGESVSLKVLFAESTKLVLKKITYLKILLVSLFNVVI